MAELIDKKEALRRLEEVKCHIPSTFLSGVDVAKAVIEKMRPVDIGMTIKGNRTNLCSSCMCEYPMCPAKAEDLYFGDGTGGDNVCACAYYVSNGSKTD